MALAASVSSSAAGRAGRSYRAQADHRGHGVDEPLGGVACCGEER
jgi:hypothetical protein